MTVHPVLAHRTALMWCAIPALVLAILQAAVAAMAWPSAERVWPGLVAMMVAQAVLLVGAAACLVGLVRLAQEAAGAERVVRATAGALSPLPWVLLALLAATTAVWFVVDAPAAIGAAVFSLVGAQAWFALRAARRALGVPVR